MAVFKNIKCTEHMQGGMLPLRSPSTCLTTECTEYSEIQFRTANQRIRSLPYREPEATHNWRVIILDPNWLVCKRRAAAVRDSLVFVLAVQGTETRL